MACGTLFYCKWLNNRIYQNDQKKGTDRVPGFFAKEMQRKGVFSKRYRYLFEVFFGQKWVKKKVKRHFFVSLSFFV
jgi:hypothetical protein